MRDFATTGSRQGSMKEAPVEHEFQASTAKLTYFEWGSRPGPVVLLLHATGFHARCWDQVVRYLPDDCHVYALDMRGHGRSEKVAPYVWRSFGQDVGDLVEHLQIHDAVGVGHSMGGHCLVQVAASHPVFKRLLLIDPVIFEPDAYSTDRYRGFAEPEDHPVAKRRNQWDSWEEMYERFRDREPFSVWRDEALRDYCRYGVLARADGQGFELACPPLVESTIYLGNTSTDIYDVIPLVRIPVVVLRAKPRDPAVHQIMDFSLSPTWERIAEQFSAGRDVPLPHLSHFIPMQNPELVARFIEDEDAIENPVAA